MRFKNTLSILCVILLASCQGTHTWPRTESEVMAATSVTRDPTSNTRAVWGPAHDAPGLTFALLYGIQSGSAFEVFAVLSGNTGTWDPSRGIQDAHSQPMEIANVSVNEMTVFWKVSVTTAWVQIPLADFAAARRGGLELHYASLRGPQVVVLPAWYVDGFARVLETPDVASSP